MLRKYSLVAVLAMISMGGNLFAMGAFSKFCDDIFDNYVLKSVDEYPLLKRLGFSSRRMTAGERETFRNMKKCIASFDKPNGLEIKEQLLYEEEKVDFSDKLELLLAQKRILERRYAELLYEAKQKARADAYKPD